MTVRVHYMMSFSRSGETLMQRHLSQCEGVSIGYNLMREDPKTGSQLNKYLRDKVPEMLPEKVAARLEITTDTVVAKAIWPSPRQRQGFVLCRHPYAILSSIASSHSDAHAEQRGRKLARICGYVHPVYGSTLLGENSMDMLTLKVAQAWAHRMRVAYHSGAPIVHYERFVTDHPAMLRRLCAHLGTPCDAGVIDAHLAFPAGEIGHGGFVLSSPVDPSRAFSKAGHLTGRQREIIRYICAETMDLYGYGEETGDGLLAGLCDDRFAATPAT